MSLSPLEHVHVSSGRNQIAPWTNTLSALLNVGFVLLRTDGQVDDATPTACTLFGGTSPDDLRPRWPAIHEKLAPSLTDAQPGGQTVEITFELDGDRRRVKCEVHPLTEDECTGFLLLVQSSERVVALEHALQLASRYQSLASLYATTAHDFNGSLNAITLNVEMLSRTLEPGAFYEGNRQVQRNSLQAIRQELGVVAVTVGSVLDESRLEDSEASRCDLVRLVESVVGLLRAKAERQHVTMRVERSSQAIDVMANPSAVRRVVLNLAHNALEAIPNGGEVVFRLVVDGPVAQLTVSDTGPGVPSDIQQKIWELYFTTKSTGHGIGLHVVRNLVHAHGGTVTLDRASSGAQFTVRLPLAP